MDDKTIGEIVKQFPPSLRYKFIPADLEGPGELIFALNPPDIHLIQWEVGFARPVIIGEFDDDEDSSICLRVKYFEKFRPIFSEILNKLDRGDVKIICADHTSATLRYYQRCGVGKKFE